MSYAGYAGYAGDAVTNYVGSYPAGRVSGTLYDSYYPSYHLGTAPSPKQEQSSIYSLFESDGYLPLFITHGATTADDTRITT